MNCRLLSLLCYFFLLLALKSDLKSYIILMIFSGGIYNEGEKEKIYFKKWWFWVIAVM